MDSDESRYDCISKHLLVMQFFISLACLILVGYKKVLQFEVIRVILINFLDMPTILLTMVNDHGDRGFT